MAQASPRSTRTRRLAGAGESWADVDLDTATLTVTLDKARRQDSIPLSVEAVAALRLWRNKLATWKGRGE